MNNENWPDVSFLASFTLLYRTLLLSGFIYFQPEEIPLAFLKIQVGWQYILSNFGYMKGLYFSFLFEEYFHLIENSRQRYPLSFDLHCYKREVIYKYYPCSPVYNMSFLSDYFEDIFFIFGFQQCNYDDLLMVFFIFILLRVLWVSWVCRLIVFTKFLEVITYFFMYYF